jgi:hypothetical protein
MRVESLAGQTDGDVGPHVLASEPDPTREREEA